MPSESTQSMPTMSSMQAKGTLKQARTKQTNTDVDGNSSTRCAGLKSSGATTLVLAHLHAATGIARAAAGQQRAWEQVPA
eukprot:925858-Amphidinium_carterae.1